jgi:ribokinase
MHESAGEGTDDADDQADRTKPDGQSGRVSRAGRQTLPKRGVSALVNGGPFVVVVGSINVDFVCEVENIPRPGETVLAPGYVQTFGGKGANQAVAAARALGRSGRVAMVSAVGEDDLGRQAVAALEREGIDVAGVARSDAPTGCAFITVSKAGENAITVASGANARAAAAGIPELWPGAVCLGQMEIPPAETLAAAARASEAGARFIFNFAPASADEPEVVRAIMARANVLVVNEHELEASAALLGVPSGEELAASCTGLAETLGCAVVATAGPGGAFLSIKGAAALHVPAPRVAVRDTTGAGDCLVGILAAGLAEGRALRDVLATAVCGASLACEAPGARAGMPDRARLGW